MDIILNKRQTLTRGQAASLRGFGIIDLTSAQTTVTTTSTPKAQNAKEIAVALLVTRIGVLDEIAGLLANWASYLPAKYDNTWKKAGFVDQMKTATNSVKALVDSLPVGDPQLLTIVPQLQTTASRDAALRNELYAIRDSNTPDAADGGNTADEIEDQVNAAIDTAVSNPTLILLGLAALGAVVLLVNRR